MKTKTEKQLDIIKKRKMERVNQFRYPFCLLNLFRIGKIKGDK